MFAVPTLAGFLVSVFVVLHANFALSQEYCDIKSCSAGAHTICRFPNSGAGPNCQGYVAAPMSSEDKIAIVKRHNDLRQKVALGQEQRGNPGPQPSASNMQQLNWDDELAKVAQRLADQCASGHDTCRNVARFLVGQNIWTQWGSSRSILNSSIADAVDSWNNEVSNFNPKDIKPYRFDGRSGHYSQVQWADTKYVGCAVVLDKKDGWYYRNFICNYGPAGNFVGATLYKTGPPASACPNGQGTIAGLCQ